MRFVLATRNRHKLDEYRAILAPHEVEAMPAGIELPPEGVTSFEDNARAKAEALARALAERTPGRPSSWPTTRALRSPPWAARRE